MSTHAAAGMSTERDAQRAGHAAAAAALSGLRGTPDLAIVFATVGYDQELLLRSVRSTLGAQCVVVGCSGEGVISSGISAELDFAVSVMVATLDGARAEALIVEGYGEDPAGAAAELARRVGATTDVIGLMVFPDGLVGNCSEFLAELRAAIPEVVVVGGTSGDDMAFVRTYQYCDERVLSGSVAALVLRGRGRMAVSISHGCAPVGPHQTITEADGGWVRQIDGRPAWNVFKEYLDGDSEDLNAEGIVHLCIGTSAMPDAEFVADPMIIRTPLALDKSSGALFFPGGGLQVGQRVRMTRRDAVRIRSTASACAQQITAGSSREPAFVLQFDCAGRGKVMFGDHAADEILTPLRTEIGEHVPWAGFHTYGEIAETESVLRYHNYTVALCAFYDA